MTTLEEAELDIIHVILEGMIEAVVVDQDQVWEPVLKEIELDVLNVGNVIILLQTIWTQRQRVRTNTANV